MADRKKMELTYIKIISVSPALKAELIAISKNQDISLSSLLKPKLREIANSYPLEVRRYKD